MFGKKILETVYSTFLPWCCLSFLYVVFQDVVCIVVVVLCVLL